MASTIKDVERYLWLHGTATDLTLDPVDLLRELLDAHLRLKHENNVIERRAKRAEKAMRRIPSFSVKP